jgi:hypothetical protein
MPRYQYLRKSLTWKKKRAEKICFEDFSLLLSVSTGTDILLFFQE